MSNKPSKELNNIKEPTDVENTSTDQPDNSTAPALDIVEEQEQKAPATNVKTNQTVKPNTPKTTTEEDEQLKLAKELNLTIRTDISTGKPILPSTPAMRAAAAAAARKPVYNRVEVNIEDFVKENYGAIAAENPNIKLVVTTLVDYIKRMSGNASIDETAGGEQQSKLANMYDVVLSLQPEVSQTALEIIVAVVKQNQHDAFKQTTALRFANTMALNTERSLRFQLLTTLFMSLAAGTSKKDLAKTLNIRQLLEYITERNAKANISEFIN